MSTNGPPLRPSDPTRDTSLVGNAALLGVLFLPMAFASHPTAVAGALAVAACAVLGRNGLVSLARRLDGAHHCLRIPRIGRIEYRFTTYR